MISTSYTTTQTARVEVCVHKLVLANSERKQVVCGGGSYERTRGLFIRKIEFLLLIKSQL